MKRVLFFFVIVVCALGPRNARASDVLPPGVLALDERNDAWLHDHCSYRGIELYTAELVAGPGTITELVSVTFGLFARIETRRVKVFRCDAKPSFWTGAFVAAPAASVRCEEETPLPKLCVPPIRRRPGTAGNAKESAASAVIVPAVETVTSSNATIPEPVAISVPTVVRAPIAAAPRKKDRRANTAVAPRPAAPRPAAPRPAQATAGSGRAAAH